MPALPQPGRVMSPEEEAAEVEQTLAGEGNEMEITK